jgi:lipopolysaccharide transport system permease protein
VSSVVTSVETSVPAGREPPPAVSAPQFDVVVEAGRVEGQYWRDIFHYRELLVILAWRDVAVRYKQTFVGLAWVVGRPLLTVVALTVVFGQLSELAQKESIPYPLFVLVALLPWQLFSTSLGGSSTSLVGNSALISKVYFPRLIIPISSLLSQLLDFFVTAVMVVPFMVLYGVYPGWQVVFAPLFVLLVMGCAAGAGLCLGALNVRYRDVGHMVPFLIQFGLYVSPVGYSASLVRGRWRLLYSLNPLVGIIDGFRWCFFGAAAEPYWPGVAMSAAITGVLLLAGVWYFRRTERTFADLI